MNAGSFHIFFHRIHNIGSPVADRKHPVSPFCFQRHMQSFKIIHGIQGGKPVDRTVQKTPVSRYRTYKRLNITLITDIAPAFAGYHQLSAQLRVLFQQHRPGAQLRGAGGRHHSRRTSAYYSHIKLKLQPDPPQPFHKPRTHPKSLPGFGRSLKPHPFSLKP